MYGLSHGMLNVCTGFTESQAKKQVCWCRAKYPSSVTAPVSPSWSTFSKLRKAKEWLEKEARTLCFILSYLRRILAYYKSALSVSDQQSGLVVSWLPGSLAATWATWKLLLLHFHDPLFPLHMKFSFNLYKIKGKKIHPDLRFPV